MKKYLIIILFIFIAKLNIQAQQLSNTYWTIYDTNGNFFEYYHFYNDTLDFSSDNITYIHRGLYKEIGNLFFIDAPTAWSSQCTQGDTGKYTFTIKNDTLDFTLIEDPCVSGGRPSVFGSYIYVRFYPTAVEIIADTPELLVYPNPSMNGIFYINCSACDRVCIFDVNGSKLLENSISPNRKIDFIDLSELAQGVYFAQLYKSSTVKMLKLVK